jgi:hypothetical protein
MTVRFCTACEGEVEAIEGHCLLGHPLRHEAVTGSIDDLRAEVNVAYEEASFRVATVLVEEGETPKGLVITPVAVVPPPPPPPPPHRHRPSYEEMWAAYADDAEGSNDPIAAFAPPPRMDWGPKRLMTLRRKAHAAP